MFNWWVLLHLAGVFVFLLAHGVSTFVLFRLRRERDPQKVATLLEISGTSVKGFYVGFVILLVGGFAAAASGHLFGFAWIWVSVGVLVVTSIVMWGVASPYYRRVGVVARALAGGTEAVGPEEFDQVLRDNRSTTVAVVGLLGLAIILYMMVMKPTFGAGAATSAAPGGCRPAATVHVSASADKFDASCLAAPAGRAFAIVFDNLDTDAHNVAIYTDPSAQQVLFRGDIFQGSKTETYHVKALPAGTYYFRCDVHVFMNGTFKVVAGAGGSGGTPAGTSGASGTSGSG